MLKRIKELKLKERLNSGYFVVIMLMVLSGVLSIIGFGVLTGSVVSYINVGQKADTAVKMCRIDVNIAARIVREMAMNPDEADWEAYTANVNEKMENVGVQLEVLKSTGVIEDELYQKYDTALYEWASIGYAIMKEVREGNQEQAVNDILDKCAPALDEVVLLVKELDVLTDEVKAEEMRIMTITVIGSIAMVIIFIVLAAVIASRIGKVIISSILEPLSEVEHVAQELTNGNLHSTIEYHSEDEIGSLAHNLRKSIRILGTYVDDISRIMKEFSAGDFDVQPEGEWKGDFVAIAESIMTFEKAMAETVTGITEVAEQVNSGAEQVSASATDMAHGATDQAAVTEELTATLASVAERVAQNAESAKVVSGEVEHLGTEIVSSNEKMQEMVNSMSEISATSNEISKIIATINDIADQTNLLALNASIEAARAGEAGRGFAVVADQVSVLAAQSSEAAKVSTNLIQSSVNAVEKGIVIADETAKKLEEVVVNSREITEKVTDIAVTLEEQNEAIRQINHGVEQINDVVQTNSATSEECAAASQEMNSQAEHLTELIDKFRVMDV